MTVYNIEDMNFKRFNRSVDDFCYRIAKIICGKNKQHAIISITGLTGAGKSYTAITIALMIAMYVVQIKGGKLSDYFDMTRVGVINASEIRRILDKMNDKFSINILDDIGVGLNNRKWQSKQNILMNDIVQTFRINSNVLILTSPAEGLMDKVVRERAHYLIEMQTPFFDLELTQAKIFKNTPAEHGKKIYHQFVQDSDNCKVKRNFFPKPPQEYCDEYDRKRDEQFNIMLEEKKKDFDNMLNGEPEEKEKKTLKKDLYKQHLEDFDAGKFGDMSLPKSCAENGLDYQQVIKLRSSISKPL